MVLNIQKWDKISELIFEYPGRAFTIRELSKMARIPKSSVQRYLKKLRSDGIITLENKIVISPYIKFLKAFHIIGKLFKTGLADYLDKELRSSVIIIFGGARKGEYDKDSDIDLFVGSTGKKELNLKPFEKKLGHKVHLFIKKDINELPPMLLNNVVNGIKLSGYFKVKMP